MVMPSPTRRSHPAPLDIRIARGTRAPPRSVRVESLDFPARDGSLRQCRLMDGWKTRASFQLRGS